MSRAASKKMGRKECIEFESEKLGEIASMVKFSSLFVAIMLRERERERGQ